MSGWWAREVTIGHMIVYAIASCIHVSKLSLEDSSSNWDMSLEHSNVLVRICSYGNGMINDVADRLGKLLRYMLLREDSGYVFSNG